MTDRWYPCPASSDRQLYRLAVTKPHAVDELIAKEPIGLSLNRFI